MPSLLSVVGEERLEQGEQLDEAPNVLCRQLGQRLNELSALRSSLRILLLAADVGQRELRRTPVCRVELLRQ